jgi:uncharacterized protein (DUF427 family)
MGRSLDAFASPIFPAFANEPSSVPAEHSHIDVAEGTASYERGQQGQRSEEKMASKGSAYDKFPDYRVDVSGADRHIVVRLNGEVIADSRRALVVNETKHAPVYYFPREDVAMDRLTATEHQTFCPFKGNASYWTVDAAGEASENTVWGYLDPFDEAKGLKGCLAFYEDRVAWEISDT